MRSNLIRRWQERGGRTARLTLPFDDIMEFALALLSFLPKSFVGWGGPSLTASACSKASVVNKQFRIICMCDCASERRQDYSEATAIRCNTRPPPDDPPHQLAPLKTAGPAPARDRAGCRPGSAPPELHQLVHQVWIGQIACLPPGARLDIARAAALI